MNKSIVKPTESRWSRRFFLGALALTASPAFAVAPIDLTAAGTELAGYVGTTAGYALAIYVAIRGVKVILRVFGMMAK